MYTVSVRPFISFYGAKYRQSARLPVPEYDLIVEPFAGSLGYSVRYGAGLSVLGVERDPTIARLWHWLLATNPEQIRSLPLLNADDDLREMTWLAPEARDLMGFWVNSGAVAPRNRPSKWMREYATVKPQNYWGAPVRDRIADQLQYTTDWRVFWGDYTSAPDVEATWLIDPPYQLAGKHYRHGSAGIDFAALGEWCRSRRGQVIVCEQAGADWLPFRPVDYAVKATGRGKSGSYSHEAIWTNDFPEALAA